MDPGTQCSAACHALLILYLDKTRVFFSCFLFVCFVSGPLFFLYCEPWFADWLLGGQTSAVFLRPCTYVPSVRGNGRRADYRPVVDLQCAVEEKATSAGSKLQPRSCRQRLCGVWTQLLLVVEERRCKKQSGGGLARAAWYFVNVNVVYIVL